MMLWRVVHRRPAPYRAHRVSTLEWAPSDALQALSLLRARYRDAGELVSITTATAEDLREHAVCILDTAATEEATRLRAAFARGDQEIISALYCAELAMARACNE